VEPSGPVQACNGIALCFYLYIKELSPPIPFEADRFVLKYYNFERFYITLRYSIELRQLYNIILMTSYIFRCLPYARTQIKKLNSNSTIQALSHILCFQAMCAVFTLPLLCAANDPHN
jgi:hypothetical protein